MEIASDMLASKSEVSMNNSRRAMPSILLLLILVLPKPMRNNSDKPIRNNRSPQVPCGAFEFNDSQPVQGGGIRHASIERNHSGGGSGDRESDVKRIQRPESNRLNLATGGRHSTEPPPTSGVSGESKACAGQSPDKADRRFKRRVSLLDIG
jgi:hypothetical protein